MATGYDDAVAELYRAPHEAFVAERARLSGELKAQGDKNGAATLAKLRRPTLSAWAVNQLWWQARENFEELFAIAARLRAGDLAASGAHRQALNGLVTRVTELLEAGGHPATEATLRRVTTTLSALAAVGSFDPNTPGALTGDRDPPGFDAVTLAPALPEAEQQRHQAEATAARQRRQLEESRAKKQAERERLEATLRAAKREADAHTHKISRLRTDLAAAEELLEKEKTRIDDLERRLAELEAAD